MATQKKTTRSTNRTTTRNGRSGSTSGSRSTTRSTGNRAQYSAPSRSSEPFDPKLQREILLTLLLAACIFLFLCNFGLCGNIGKIMAAVQFGLFGMLAYITPPLLFVAVIFGISNAGNPAATRKLTASVVVYFLLGMILELISKRPQNTDVYSAVELYRLAGEEKNGGGLLAGSLCYASYHALSMVGTLLVLLVVGLICAVVLTEKSFLDGVKRNGSRVREEADRMAEQAAISAERRREERMQRRQEHLALMEQQRQEREEEAARIEEEKRLALEQKEDEKILRINKRVSGVEQISLKEDPEPEVPAALPDHTAEQSAPVIHTAVAENIAEVHALPAPAEKQAKPAEMSVRKEEAARSAHAGASKLSASIPDPTAEIHDELHEIVYQGSPIPAEPIVPDGYGEEDMMPEMPDMPEMMEETATATAANQNWYGLHPEAEDYGVADDMNPEAAYEQAPEEPAAYEPVSAAQAAEEPESGDGRLKAYLSEKERAAAENIPIHREREPEKEILENGFALAGQSFLTKSEPKDYSGATANIHNMPPLPGGNAGRTAGSRPASSAGAARPATPATNTAAPAPKPPVKPMPYQFPPLDLLKRGEKNQNMDSERELRETAAKLEQTLKTFGVNARVTDISQGPSVTRYELQPEMGVKVSKIVSLSDDIKLNLAATDIRIEAPIPGKAAVGIEIPNKENQMVYLRELIDTPEFKGFKSNLAFAVGKDIAGQTVVTDIAKMPHLLIAGSTGSGKSVCINTLILSLIYKTSPDDVKLIMVDPKVVELSVYNDIPHLLIPVVTDPKKASAALNWGVAEMTRRYKLFEEAKVRDLKGYNEYVRANQGEDEHLAVLPQIVIIVDELADLMMVSAKDVEDAICRLAQLARAAGIHLIIATQRPSVDVITGLIKANMPSRIAFAVSSGTDSRTILDMNGAEKLLGKGDMLFYPQNLSKPIRVQGAFVSDGEIQKITDFLKNQAYESSFGDDVAATIENGTASDGSSGGSADPGDGRDELFERAGRYMIEKEKGSIGNLQRVFKIGFNRAARIMDQLCEAGVVGDEEGTKPRKILMSMEEFDALLHG